MLKDILLEAGKRRAVVDDCVRLVEEQVDQKSGLTGIAIKGAFALVKTVKPGFLAEAIDHLLDEFVEHLEPHHARAVSAGGDVETYFRAHAAEVADSLLGVTDSRARHARNATLKKAYARLRPSGQKHVESAVPGIAKILAKHTSSKAA